MYYAVKFFNDKYTPISTYSEVESNQTFLKKQIDRIFNFQFFAISILKKTLISMCRTNI